MESGLFNAIEEHDLGRLAAMLKSGADPNAEPSDQPSWVPLKLAVGELADGGPIEAVILLLRHGAVADGGGEPGGATALILAAMDGQLEAARLLLAAGGDPNVVDDEGDSPLRLCAERGDRDMAALLLLCGADRTIERAGGLSGNTALGWAAAKLDLPMIELLLRAGADSGTTDADRERPSDHLPPRTPENAALWDAAAVLLGRVSVGSPRATRAEKVSGTFFDRKKFLTPFSSL